MFFKINILKIHINSTNPKKLEPMFITYLLHGPIYRKLAIISMFLLYSFPISLAAIDIDFNVPSRVNVCEICRYSVQVEAADEPVGNIIATIQMPEGFSYLQKSTHITFPDGSSSTQDPEVREIRLTWKLSDLFDSGHHVVINEFEQNPEGEDSGNEWVELYNPTWDDVDIGGWKLVNNDNDEYDIPDGTIISSKDFWHHTFSGRWLDNSDEGIKLYDDERVLVDETPIKADARNDFRCWARYPNGHDTDNNSDWSFLQSTKGSSNGDLSPGDSISIEFDMIATCAALSSQKLRAEASYNGGTSANESSPITVNEGFLTISKTSNVSEANLGDLIKWTIFVENVGTGSAYYVVINDTIGQGLRFKSAVPDPFESWSGLKQHKWHYDEIKSNENKTINITTEIIGYEDLFDEADASWGCNDEICQNVHVRSIVAYKLLDFGDTPSPFPTLIIDDGARHDTTISDLFLGSSVDVEIEGQPDDTATGDDCHGSDDEDGLSSAPKVLPGEINSIDLRASIPLGIIGYLNAWVDFNGDGDWDDPDEHIFYDVELSDGLNQLSFSAPTVPGTTPGIITKSRFRLSTQRGLSYFGFAPDGEVEDHLMLVVSGEAQDFGDACDDLANPHDYPTLLASDGARHIIEADFHLGYEIDDEPDGQPSERAEGDGDDEDGILFVEPMTRGGRTNVEIVSSAPGKLDAWIDFDRDGNWRDAGDHIFNGVDLSAGLNRLYFDVPANAIADDGGSFTFARFRFGSTGRLSFCGPAQDGEVEDYALVILEDSDGDGFTDRKEGRYDSSPPDRDEDGIFDWQDYDPSGCFYDEDTGHIIDGGRVSVNGPGIVEMMCDGHQNGRYRFWTDGTPGTYTLTFDPPPGYSLSTKCLPQLGSFDPTGLFPDPYPLGAGEYGNTNYLTYHDCASNPHYLSFDLDRGDSSVINNNIPLTRLASLGGQVWEDSDADGVRDLDEPKLSGLAIKLLDGYGNEIASSTSNVEGFYSFGDLTSGQYCVEFTAPVGRKFSPMDQGTDDDFDSDANPDTGKTAMFFLESGDEYLSLDAGLYRFACICGRAWCDSNANGIQERGERGLPEVAVHLHNKTGICATITTDSYGNYVFGNLEMGDYYLSFALPSGHYFSPTNQGTDETADSDVDPITGQTPVISLQSGDLYLNWDAGLYPLSNIRVVKVASTAVAKPLEEVAFTIKVTNIGNAELNPVKVVDLLPSDMKYVASNAQFPAEVVKNSNGTTTIYWNNLGPLAPGASNEITFSSRVNEDAYGKLINSVVVVGTSSYGEEVYSYDEFAVDLLSLNVSKAVSQNTVKRGDVVTYSITVCNEGSLPLNDVVVWDVFDKQVKLLSFSPHPDRDGRWHLGPLDPGNCVQITLKVKVPKQEVEFNVVHEAQGVGFVDVTNKFTTTLPPYVIHNLVYALCEGFVVKDFDFANVTVLGDPGSDMELMMHGSGYYDNKGRIRLHTENKSLEMEKDFFVDYSSTTLGLHQNRSTTYSSRWLDLARSKNHVTGSYMHESYRYASNIDQESYMKLDENESIMEVDSKLNGVANIGFFKGLQCNATVRDTPSFSSDERYLGSFRIKERIDEYGSGITSDRSVSGKGFVAVDKKVKELQGTYESGTGSYQSDERIRTHTSYLAKDINTTHEPSSCKLTGSGTAWANQSQSWKEGMWSQNKGVNFIGEKYSGASRLDKETEFLGLNQMKSKTNFSGRSSFKAILPDLVNVRAESFGDHSIQRMVLFRGVPKYDIPHMEMNVDGEIYYLPNGILAAQYVIVLENDGNRTLGPVQVTDVFPFGAKFINASVRPSNWSSSAVNWTLTHLSIGDESSIVLWLNVTECQKGVLTNEVCAIGSHADQLVEACNFSTLEADWLTCYFDRTISATKTAFLDSQEDDVVWYNLTIQNLGNSTLFAHVTDHLPEGMVLLNSSLEPSSYEKGIISWNHIRIDSFGNQTITYKTKVHCGGTFVNRVMLDSNSLDGLSSRPSYASSVVVVDPFQGSRIPTGWRPPDWGIDYGGHLIEDLCDDYM